MGLKDKYHCITTVNIDLPVNIKFSISGTNEDKKKLDKYLVSTNQTVKELFTSILKKVLRGSNNDDLNTIQKIAMRKKLTYKHFSNYIKEGIELSIYPEELQNTIQEELYKRFEDEGI